ncbi:hypothetical protein QR680_008837 [Steinernema hermaphroditum]|uniref:Phosphatidylinositol 4-kinase type 2 n=1 Tax=Steinernema hermaphroditum TaxID=289476 RepID=A0AA39II50_9BILA|nr:hypothetical protein QR680_008837 [Steinernema hermaphroditum]
MNSEKKLGVQFSPLISQGPVAFCSCEIQAKNNAEMLAETALAQQSDTAERSRNVFEGVGGPDISICDKTNESGEKNESRDDKEQDKSKTGSKSPERVEPPKPAEEPSYSGSLTLTTVTSSFNHRTGPASEVTKRSEFVVGSCRDASVNKDIDFNDNLRRAREAMEAGVSPLLIRAGSSGSYFIRDANDHFLAVFKPKDEEPFAPLNPKWPKFFQRMLCFCCFGRACLIPNHGYLSETGASLIDDRLCLNIVPKTRVVRLSSSAFFYGRFFGRVIEPYPKEGSYQLFVHGYKDAGTVLAEWTSLGGPEVALTPEEYESFVVQFQKMVVLDYITRNTDRHNENWLIKHVPGKEILLAAIDNGLAFPVKHPESASRFRQFPFGWASLPFAQKPWNEALRTYLLQLLTPLFLHNLCQDIKNLFRYDTSTNRLLTYTQLRVLRGQVWNLRMALLENEPPCDLVKKPQILVRRRYSHLPASDDWDECFRVKHADFLPRRCC